MKDANDFKKYENENKDKSIYLNYINEEEKIIDNIENIELND